jgi:hypothetical protein
MKFASNSDNSTFVERLTPYSYLWVTTLNLNQAIKKDMQITAIHLIKALSLNALIIFTSSVFLARCNLSLSSVRTLRGGPLHTQHSDIAAVCTEPTSPGIYTSDTPVGWLHIIQFTQISLQTCLWRADQRVVLLFQLETFVFRQDSLVNFYYWHPRNLRHLRLWLSSTTDVSNVCSFPESN